MELSIEDWGRVRPKCQSDYELEESDFDPSGDRPEVYVRFLDSYGQRWTLRGGVGVFFACTEDDLRSLLDLR